jgi:hypothetical protein
MPLESPKHVDSLLRGEVLRVVGTLNRRRDYPVFLVVGDRNVVGVENTLKKEDAYGFNARLFGFLH